MPAEPPAGQVDNTVVNLFLDDLQQKVPINVVKTSADISLNKPDRPFPRVHDLNQSSMTSPVWSEPMGMGTELRLVIRLQDEANHFLQEFVRPGGNAKGAPFSVCFRYIVLLCQINT